VLPLILFIVLVVVVVVLFELRERKRAHQPAEQTDQPSSRPDGCCGEHLVCERETLLQTNAKIEYYDDEELDALAGIAPEDYTEEQEEAIRSVFQTLKESDVAGWCRSMQLRAIALPEDIREEALLIVRERRNHNK